MKKEASLNVFFFSHHQTCLCLAFDISCLIFDLISHMSCCMCNISWIIYRSVVSITLSQSCVASSSDTHFPRYHDVELCHVCQSDSILLDWQGSRSDLACCIFSNQWLNMMDRIYSSIRIARITSWIHCSWNFSLSTSCSGIHPF